MKNVIKAAVFCTIVGMVSILNAAERVWTTDRPIGDIISAANNNLSEYSEGEFDLHRLGKIKDLDLEINIDGFTRARYYKFSVQLRSPIGKLWKLNKTLEVWGEDNQTTIRTYIDIGWGKTHRFPLRWVDRIKSRIICGIENSILDLEKYSLQKATTDSQ